MSSRYLIPLGIVALLIAGAVGWVAWNRWPPLLRYQSHRVDAQILVVFRDYLSGRREFESSAAALASLWKRKGLLAFQLTSVPSSGAGSLTAVQLPVPDEVTMPDERLVKLSDRASEIMIGPEAWARVQEMKRKYPEIP